MSGAWVNAAKVRKAQCWRSFWKLFVGVFLGLEDSCVLEIYVDIYRYIIIYYIYLFSIHIISANLKLVIISTRENSVLLLKVFFLMGWEHGSIGAIEALTVVGRIGGETPGAPVNPQV